MSSYDWSEDIVQIQNLMPKLLEAFNKQDYDAAEQIATTIVLSARYLTQTAEILADAK